MSNQPVRGRGISLAGESRYPDLPSIANIVDGTVILEGDVRAISSVGIDSRECAFGSLFIALPGTTSDGEKHVDDAYRRGAVGAIVRNRVAPSGGAWPLPVIVVDDTLKALHQLAAWYVDTHLVEVTRIGITGSNGKTTTKEIVVALLSLLGTTFGSYGNLNSETGLPLSVFSTPPGVDFAVYEMAMSAPGEMSALARIVRPDIAIITNIGSAHIGKLGSKDAIAREKKAIASQFTGSEALVLHDADEYAAFLSEGIDGEVAWFGFESQGVRAELNEKGTTELVFADGARITIPLPGSHNAINALAALRLAEIVGLSTEMRPRAIEIGTIPDGRAQRMPYGDGGLIIHDAYNANPDSMVAGLEMAYELQKNEYPQSRLVVILGDMYELGERSDEAHSAIVEYALTRTPAVACFVGERFGTALQGIGKSNVVEEDEVRRFDVRSSVVISVATTDALKSSITRIIGEEDVVFLKGSRAVELEQLIPVLQSQEVSRV